MTSWLLQEVMQRGAEEIGKMLNKGLDRQQTPSSAGMWTAFDGQVGMDKGVLEALHDSGLKGQQQSIAEGEMS
jgi:hypothetical protein